MGLGIRYYALSLLVVTALGACIPDAAIKRGDAAAARGQWRDAERAYAAAVTRDPNNVDLAKKYGDAKTRAIAEALRTADACQASGDPVCIDRELAYALKLDPGNVEAAKLRRDARGQLATAAVVQARTSFAAGDPLATWKHLDKAKAFGVPADLADEVARLETQSADQTAQFAQERLDHARNEDAAKAIATLTAARELAAAATARAPVHSSLVADIDQALARAIAAEVKVRTAEGDAAIARGDFESAASAYEAGFRASRDTRIGRLATYARAVSSAKVAVTRRSFAEAAKQLRIAVATQQDSGVAQTLLDAVEPRVYRIRLESIAISATKPGTSSPWVGKPWWREAAPIAAAAVGTWQGGPAVGKIAYDVTAAVANVPPENRPTLVSIIDLPDGRQLRTRNEKGIYVIYGAEFYLYGNQFDQRTIRLSVFHVRSGGNESVAVANVPIGQIIGGTIDAAVMHDNAPAFQQVVFAVEPAEPWQDGNFAKLELQDKGENKGSSRSTPRREATRLQLHAARLDLPVEAGDGDGSHPDPYFEIFQDGRQVFRSTTAKDTRTATWSATATDLFVDPSEVLVVRLMDSDFTADDTITSWRISGQTMLAGSVTLTTAKGTSLSLTLAARSDRPR